MFCVSNAKCFIVLSLGEDFKTVQKEVADILNGRILVGHALHNDLKVIWLQICYFEDKAPNTEN